MFRLLATVVLVAAVLHGSARVAHGAEPEQVLSSMRAAAGRLDSYTVVQMKRERFGDDLSAAETMEVKYRKGRTYLHILAGPREGAEALYVPGWNGNKARIHKGSFPDVTLNLDPHGSLMMDGQHHPIEHVGFDHLVATLLANVQRATADGAGHMRLLPETQVHGRAADVIEMDTPGRADRRAVQVQVQKGDDLWVLAPRLGVDPYVLLHANGLRRAAQLKPGMTLQVPAYYGSRTVLAVDRQNHLPSRLEVYDGKGRLYELYEWSRFDPTPLPDSAFSPDNPAYNF